MAFRELFVDVDAIVFETLGDSIVIDGRPVLGMFTAPWQQPKMGKLNTGLREPRVDIRVADAIDLVKGQLVSVDLPALDGGGEYDLLLWEPDGSGIVTLILRKRA